MLSLVIKITFQVEGCGKEKGLQLVLDSQRTFSSTTANISAKPTGYRIFITLNGVVTSHVPYLVSPGFDGEYNFYLHGIHHIVVFEYFSLCINT